jgi:iron-sulfur cluster assembly accessory protein
MNLNLTDNAKTYLSSMIDNQQRYVSLQVNGGGCSGFKYDWNYVDLDTDFTVIDGLLAVDPMAEMFLFGCTVDYVQELGGSYLTVVNPNASASCGCGESFAI